MGGGVAQRPADVVLPGSEQWSGGVAGGLEVAAEGGDEPVVVKKHGASPAALAEHGEVFVVGSEVEVLHVQG